MSGIYTSSCIITSPVTYITPSYATKSKASLKVLTGSFSDAPEPDDSLEASKYTEYKLLLLTFLSMISLACTMFSNHSHQHFLFLQQIHLS
ncbi:hypothetical protein [Clostridium sp.]|uniref:hypothetical protein n=1 Tax=Clostridium sp. TaxID=1506 RepID=UPI00260936DF|nr:hypothetical protein [Clostridium sp.]